MAREFGFPAVVTHNYNADSGPFRNLCELPAVEAEAVLEGIRATGRRIKPNYLMRRLAVEAWLVLERQRKLGATRLERPIYFFLGDFADGKDAWRPRAIVLPLAAFSPRSITFTYGDSMSVFERGSDGGVLSLEEVRAVFLRFGMPQSRAPQSNSRGFIEVQVWDDEPMQGLTVGSD